MSPGAGLISPFSTDHTAQTTAPVVTSSAVSNAVTVSTWTTACASHVTPTVHGATPSLTTVPDVVPVDFYSETCAIPNAQIPTGMIQMPTT